MQFANTESAKRRATSRHGGQVQLDIEQSRDRRATGCGLCPPVVDIANNCPQQAAKVALELTMSAASVVPAHEILGQLDGAQIVSVRVEDESGMQMLFSDGRVLVVTGYFALSVLSAEVLH